MKAFKVNTISYLLCFVLLAIITLTAGAVNQLTSGSGSFVFADSLGNKNKPITVWYHKPKESNASVPVVFVMHGVKRNGREYRDSWVEHAEKGNFLLLVPEFSEKYYPGSKQYNLGNMFSSPGKSTSKSKWTYTTIEHIFDYIKDIAGLKAKGYSIYGHSAGAQFVHRMILFVPKARINTAICANAGWYTMPTRRFEFPYGLKKSPISLKQLKNAFSQNLIVLLGDKDTDENHKHLRKTQETMAQGKHRFERGRNFFEVAKHEATKFKTPLKWKLETVKGAGHSNSKMAIAATKLLIDTKSKTFNSAGNSSQSNSYLLETSWGQRDRYAKYSPNNERLGCWSVALAQILYFHRLAPNGTVSYLCTKKGYSIKKSLGENKFNWGIFVDKFDDKTSTASQDRVAKYIYCTSVAIQKDFGTGSYVLKKHAQRAAAIARYYECETKLYDNNKYSLTQIKQIIKREIDGRRPLMLHLRSLSTDLSDKDYHAVAVDGYRIRNGEFWIHLNMGHKGSDNGWYDFSRPILKYNDNNYRKIITVKPNYDS